jgi:hypothetical protein
MVKKGCLTSNKKLLTYHPVLGIKKYGIGTMRKRIKKLGIPMRL